MKKSPFLSIAAVFFLIAITESSCFATDCDRPFFPNQLFSVADRPNGLASGDFNGDGIADLATANRGSSDVSILLGVGNGTFEDASNFATGFTPYSIATDDFDGDGHSDLATASFGSDGISILLGNGDGTFETATTYPTVFSPFAVATGDFNGDGAPDVASANLIADNVSVLLGNGDGTFSPSNDFPAGDRPFDLLTVDINLDGLLDLVTANQTSNDVSVLLGNGDGTFGMPANFAAGSSPNSLASDDFNSDGFPDLAITNVNFDEFAVLLGNGDGTLGTPSMFATGQGPFGITAVDFNRDGITDLVTTHDDSDDVWVFLGNGVGTFSLFSNFDTQDKPLDIIAEDFNGDGFTDLATANEISENVSVFIGNGDGSFATELNFTTRVGPTEGFGPINCEATDFNGDGIYDLATANRDSDDVAVLLGNGDGTFGVASNFTTRSGPTEGFGPISVIVADMNDDGNVDLATANRDSDDVAILIGNGDGTFIAATNFTTRSGPTEGFGPISITVSDFNGDGIVDLVTANRDSDDVAVLLGNGDGTFAAATNFTTRTGPTEGFGPADVATADFDGNGTIDLVTANNDSDDITVLLGNGDGTFSATFNFTTRVGATAGFGPVEITIADFNNDTFLDLATTSIDSDDVSILLGNGDGTFMAALNFETRVAATGGFGPVGISAVDYNSDGAMDLITSNVDSDDVTLLPGNGDGSFGLPSSFEVGNSPVDIVTADFDDDGAIDLATVNFQTDDVSVLLNQCAPVLLGDVNRDGSVNLLDVQPFIDVLNSGNYQIEADINQDGSVNLLDVGGFIDVISG